MTELLLQRYNYSETETEGRLWLDDDEYIYTLERPWIAGLPGGLPFESCVPDGKYSLQPHIRASGDRVLALRNPALSVFYTDQERDGAAGRYLILLHSANYVEEVAGCIAPGLVRTIAGNRRMVRSSRAAMAKLMALQPTSLLIESDCGTDV